MKVTTYYDPTGNDPHDDFKLLLLWRENWSDHGFIPVVLNEFQVRQHPLFDAFNERISRLPSVNPIAYERSCYIRWLGYALYGGLCVDWDLFTYVKPSMFSRRPNRDLYSFQKHVPSMLFGAKQAFEKAVAQIMEYEVGQRDIPEGFNAPHVSDMYMMLNSGITFKSEPGVKNFGEEKWEKSPFVHYASGAMKAAGKLPKHKFIRELRNWK